MLDSGSDESFLNKKHTTEGTVKKLTKKAKWITGAGTLSTTRKCAIKFKLNEFSNSKEIHWNFNVDETSISHDTIAYNMIVGLDLMSELGIIIDCKAKIVEWEGSKIPMIKGRKQLS